MAQELHLASQWLRGTSKQPYYCWFSDATGLETCEKRYFKVIFNLVGIDQKTS